MSCLTRYNWKVLTQFVVNICQNYNLPSTLTNNISFNFSVPSDSLTFQEEVGDRPLFEVVSQGGFPQSPRVGNQEPRVSAEDPNSRLVGLARLVTGHLADIVRVGCAGSDISRLFNLEMKQNKVKSYNLVRDHLTSFSGFSPSFS